MICEIPEGGNVQSHDQEEIKLNSTIIAKSSGHTLTDDEITKVHSIRKI